VSDYPPSITRIHTSPPPHTHIPVLLFLNEGYQVGLLGVRYFNSGQLKGFPQASKIRRLIFSDHYDRLPRLFLGQSFLVVTTTFLISGITTFASWPLGYRGLPDWLVIVCLRSGLPGVIITGR